MVWLLVVLIGSGGAGRVAVTVDSISTQEECVRLGDTMRDKLPYVTSQQCFGYRRAAPAPAVAPTRSPLKVLT